MFLLTLIIVAWVALSLGLALLVGRAIALADAQESRQKAESAEIGVEADV